VRTVELTFDTALERGVRAVWRQLQAAGLPSLATHAHWTNRPHVTLAAAADLTTGVGTALAALPLPAELDGVMVFEGSGVLVWRVVADESLRALQASVWSALDGQERNPLHAPERWVPHVSLALRVRPGDRTRAAAVLADLPAARGQFAGARSY
jgi:2'-5' RNA ligase